MERLFQRDFDVQVRYRDDSVGSCVLILPVHPQRVDGLRHEDSVSDTKSHFIGLCGFVIEQCDSVWSGNGRRGITGSRGSSMTWYWWRRSR